tara:strand:- start:746 stop:2179 length:1434 start_codon:yes stop_codon:yes gene_type:complete
MAIDNCSTSNYLQRACGGGGGGAGGGGALSYSLRGGDGLNAFIFDATSTQTAEVDSSVLRTGNISQTIYGDRNFTGTVTIGNLNVTGTQNIINTEYLATNGPTLTLNTGTTSVLNSYDLGWVAERGTAGPNVAVLWNETQDHFQLITTTGISGGAHNPSFDISGYQGLKLGHLINTGYATIRTTTAKGDLSVSGSTYSEQVWVTGADGSWGQLITGGNELLDNGDGISTFSYNGASSATVAVDGTVVRNTSDQTIQGGIVATSADLTGASSAVVFSASGKAGIKTDSPKGDFAVSGTAYAQDVYITGIGGTWQRLNPYSDQATSFNTSLGAGSSIYTINFPKTFSANPVVNATIQNSAGGSIIPHMISGVGTSSYSLVFGSSLPDSNYSVNTSARPSATTDDGTVTQSFSTSLTPGSSTQAISYPSPFGATPYVNATIEGEGSIVPYYISGVTTSNYTVVFGAPIPSNYKIHTFAVR